MKKKIKKSTSILTIFLLAINIVFSNVNVASAQNMGVASGNNILDSVKLTHENGSTDNGFYMWETIIVNYEWSLKGQQKGDKVTFELPKELILANNIDFDLTTSDGITIGVVNANKDGTVEIEFTDPTNYIATHSDIKGTMFFETRINSAIINVPGKYPIDFELNNETETIDIDVLPDEPDSEEVVYKWGSINEEDGYIDWTIRVNYAQKELNDTVLTENLGKGQAYKKGSIVIKEAIINPSTGKPSGWNDVTDKFKVNERDDGFTINFGDITNRYEVDFKATITDTTLGKYKNTVGLHATNGVDQTITVSEKTSSGGGEGGGDSLATVRLTKKDSDTKEILKGAEFVLQDKEGNDIKTNLVTDDNGQIVVNKLKEGDYQFIETKAPQGYVIDHKPVKFTIEPGETKEVQVEMYNNKKDPITPEVPVIRPKDPEPITPEVPVIRPKDPEPITPEVPVIRPENPDNNGNTENPKTGDAGIIGFVGLGVASIGGIFINRRNRK